MNGNVQSFDVNRLECVGNVSKFEKVGIKLTFLNIPDLVQTKCEARAVLVCSCYLFVQL